MISSLNDFQKITNPVMINFNEMRNVNTDTNCIYFIDETSSCAVSTDQIAEISTVVKNLTNETSISQSVMTSTIDQIESMIRIENPDPNESTEKIYQTVLEDLEVALLEANYVEEIKSSSDLIKCKTWDKEMVEKEFTV